MKLILTWLLAAAFLVTSLTLTVLAARNTSTRSVIDQLDLSAPQMPAPASDMPALPAYVPPPPAAGQPITPPIPSVPAPAAEAEPAPETQPAGN